MHNRSGNLTALLVEKAKKVIAVEIDPRMVAELTKRFKYGDKAHKIEIIHVIFFKIKTFY
jgi:18S rRNA (adenine1779-N6/adenine1780-N6)-dimethyltransferase